MSKDNNNNITFKGNNLIEGDFIEGGFPYISNEIEINKDKKLEIELEKINESEEDNKINSIGNNIDDFNKIKINNGDKEPEIEGAKISKSKEFNEFNPIENGNSLSR